MSETRATKSGLALEAQKKLASKYDQDCAAKCMRWIADATKLPLDTSGESDSVREQLRDGTVLLKLYNAICPGSVTAKQMQPQKMPFQIMEKIDTFNRKIKEPPLNIPDPSVFTSVDLFDGMNMAQVITCLETVARKCQHLGLSCGGFGPKESAANKREFSEEQLAQGKSIIGLQMGSNKGATQSGQNFGKGRMIVD